MAITRQHTPIPLPLPERCQRKPAKTEGLSKIESLRTIIPKRSRFQSRVTLHTKNQESLKLNKKPKQSIDANTKMIEMLALYDKDIKAAIIKTFQ